MRGPTLWIAATFVACLVAAPAAARNDSQCQKSTRRMYMACLNEVRDDTYTEQTVCLNLGARGDRRECWEEYDDAREARRECAAQRRARGDVCSAPGLSGPFDPEIDPADFVEGIDNPYTPFAVGSSWVYEKETDEGTERIEIEVLPTTREILGVECTEIRDRVFLDGVPVEDTIDWLAQDVDGNVWYFGEIAQNFEDGYLTDVEGSWISGEDGAKPGFWAKAAPVNGETYRQELLWGDAEDVAEVMDVDAPDDVPFANGNPVLKTRDFTPIEPGVEEFKFYVPGVGMVLEVDPESGERLELIEYNP